LNFYNDQEVNGKTYSKTILLTNEPDFQEYSHNMKLN